MKKYFNSLLILLFAISFIAYPVHVIGQNSTNQTTTLPKELRFLVPVRELNEFVKIIDLSNGQKNFSGFSIDVFNAAAEFAIPSIRYKFFTFSKEDGTMNGTFDDMLRAVNNKEYDGAIAETTILHYRMQMVDFTMPYLDSEIGMLVRVQASKPRESALLTPATIVISTLIGILGIGVFLAVVFWIRIFCQYNRKKLPLRPAEPIMGSIMYTRLAIILVLMVSLLTISSYMPRQTSSLSLPTQRQVSDIKTLDDLKRKGSKVGYRQGAFVKNLLVSKGGLSESQLVELDSEVEMLDKLQKGTEEGGVDALIAGTHHLKLFQENHCDDFVLVPNFRLKSTGLGFVCLFHSSSPLHFLKINHLV
ncbi:glutamate receptor 2.6-like isoform X2 [Spinacia oleracea]|uniref:Glutamate receptor 2.6-like isoform X2 n=1 Tax=Spinacia oleracea TaxID=3562 RepID=A0A9R0IZ36_SPIOL|nr:glutamate receptor 2.6-like isoform X2 [Spinacia oleracea]